MISWLRKVLDDAKASQQLRQDRDHLDEQYRSLLQEKNRLQGELAKFHEAMERERKPDWEKWHNDLATILESHEVATEELDTAARELRYMADSFTLKANFVPSELKIKELECKIERYETALQALSKLGNGDKVGNSIGNAIASEVLTDVTHG